MEIGGRGEVAKWLQRMCYQGLCDVTFELSRLSLCLKEEIICFERKMDLAMTFFPYLQVNTMFYLHYHVIVSINQNACFKELFI